MLEPFINCTETLASGGVITPDKVYVTGGGLPVPLVPLPIAAAVVLPRSVSMGCGAKRASPSDALVWPRQKKPPVSDEEVAAKG